MICWVPLTLTWSDPSLLSGVDPPIIYSGYFSPPLTLLVKGGLIFLLILLNNWKDKEKPEAATSGFDAEPRIRSEAQQTHIDFIMASDVYQVGGHFFVSWDSVSLVWGKFLPMSAVLEGPDLLFGRVPTLRKTPDSPGSAKTVPTDSEREESPLPCREPSSPRVKSRQWKKYGWSIFNGTGNEC